MTFIKKLCVFSLITLFIFGMYHDLVKHEADSVPVNEISQIQHTSSASNKYLKVKVQESDSILSVVRRINKKLPDQPDKYLIKDFLYANPTMNSQKILAGNYYYFPVYD